MAGYHRAIRMQRELAGIPSEPRPKLILGERPAIFHEADWVHEARAREAVDYLASARRFRVTLHLIDGESRPFYLCGPLAEVEKRARAFFPDLHTRTISIEAVGSGSESIPIHRLNLGEVLP